MHPLSSSAYEGKVVFWRARQAGIKFLSLRKTLVEMSRAFVVEESMLQALPRLNRSKQGRQGWYRKSYRGI